MVLRAYRVDDERRRKPGISTHPAENAIKGAITPTHKKIIAPIRSDQ
jgi:hypothetical protein